MNPAEWIGIGKMSAHHAMVNCQLYIRFYKQIAANAGNISWLLGATYVCRNEYNDKYHPNLAIDIGCLHSICALVANGELCLLPIPNIIQNKIERHQNTWWHSGSFPLSTANSVLDMYIYIFISVRKQHIQIYIRRSHSLRAHTVTT